MEDERAIRGAYFNGFYPPEPTTFAGTVMTRVATAIDTRDALVEAFAPVAHDMVTYFPNEKAMTRPEVEALIDDVIADHNDQVRHASPDAIRLLDAIDGFPAQGLAVSFGAGADPQSALDAMLDTVAHTMELGARVEGYVLASANDAAELVLHGQVRLTYGIFAETGLTLEHAADRVRGVLDREGLPVLEHDEAAQQVLVGPILYEVPYHGHQLHEFAERPPN